MVSHSLIDDRILLIKFHALGYGEGIAKLFAEEGAKILVADINEKAGIR